MFQFAFARPLIQNRLLNVKALETDFDQQLRKLECCLCHVVHKHMHLTFVEGPGSTEYFSG